jgi:ABC-2 type transport system ATP-binding protein
MISIDRITKRYKGREADPQGSWISSWGVGLWLKNALRLMRLSSSATPPVSALSDVCLEIEKGEIFGLLGPNGAGKTSLIKILSALLKPTSGTALVNGYDVLESPDEVKRSVSYISTTGWMGLEWPFTVEESLLFYSGLFGIPKKVARDRIEEVLNAVVLADHREKVISQLSHGMRQRLVLARGLLVRTPVVFLDEPTVGLDPVNARHIRQLISHRISGEYGQTVMLTTHNIREVEEVCHRVGILHRGRLLAVGTVEELRRTIGDRTVTEMRVRGFVQSIAAELRGLSGVLGASAALQNEAQGAAILRIHSEKSGAGIDDILRFLKTRRVEVSYIVQSKANLEDVFLDMTGAGLR